MAPKNKGKKKYNKKRAYKKRTNNYTMVAKGVKTPLPPRYLTRLKYCQQGTITAASGTINSQQFRLNSIYDPDYTGAGHQPLAHDTFMTMYNRYRVFKCTGYVDLDIGSSGSSVDVALMGVNNTPIAYSNFTHIMEQSGVQTRTLNHQANTKRIKFSFDLPKLCGKSRNEYKTSSHTESLFGNNPSEAMFLCIWATQTAGTNSDVHYTITLFYHTEIFDPVELSQS